MSVTVTRKQTILPKDNIKNKKQNQNQLIIKNSIKNILIIGYNKVLWFSRAAWIQIQQQVFRVRLKIPETVDLSPGFASLFNTAQNLQFCQRLSQADYGDSMPVTVFRNFWESSFLLRPIQQLSAGEEGKGEEHYTGREREIFCIRQGFSFYVLHSLYPFLSNGKSDTTLLKWKPIFNTVNRWHLRSVSSLISFMKTMSTTSSQ